MAFILALVVGGGAASAETVINAQAVSDHDTFFPYAPRPTYLAGLCLVDTGVSRNPDTERLVVDSTAIDGGSGADVSPTMHGTTMAMIAGAPVNDWGMVGTAPQAIQIVSVRILEPGNITFPFSSYAAGITACLRVRQQYRVHVINLSLGSSEQPTSEDYQALGNAVERAKNYGVSVVAAAGNDDGGPIGYPAAYPGVLSVGASDTQTGGFCGFSNRGEELSLLAPGCNLDSADPTTGIANYNYQEGTSDASEIAAAALTALDSYRPDLSTQTQENDLTATPGGMLDIAQMFRDAGLEQIVRAGEEAQPGRSQPAQQQQPAAEDDPQKGRALGLITPGSAALTAIFERPRVRLQWTSKHATLIISGRPSDARLQVRYFRRRNHSKDLSVVRTLTGVFTRLTPPATVVEASVRNIDPYDTQRASPPAILVIPQIKRNISRGRGLP